MEFHHEFFYLQKVLGSCWNVYSICNQIGKLILAMDKYTERLSALWLLVIDEFSDSANDVYEKIVSFWNSTSEGKDSVVTCCLLVLGLCSKK